MAININPSKFVVGQASALWVDKATSVEQKITGLQGLALGLGFSQTSVEVPEMGERVSVKTFTGASYDEFTVNANFIPGDKTQELLRTAALQNTLLKNIRMYLKDGCHFSAPDQISSASTAGSGLTTGTSGLTVGSWTDPQIGSPSDLYTNSVSFAPAGPFTLFVAHTGSSGGTNISITAQGATGAEIELLDATTWSSLGFEDGDIVLIDNAEAAPVYGHIDTISSATIVLFEDIGDAASLTTQTLGATGAVHGATKADVGTLDVSC